MPSSVTANGTPARKRAGGGGRGGGGAGDGGGAEELGAGGQHGHARRDEQQDVDPHALRRRRGGEGPCLDGDTVALGPEERREAERAEALEQDVERAGRGDAQLAAEDDDPAPDPPP